MKKIDDAPVIARRISEFLYEYAPQFLTNSENTLKGYNDTLTLYFQYLEESGVTPSNFFYHSTFCNVMSRLLNVPRRRFSAFRESCR